MFDKKAALSLCLVFIMFSCYFFLSIPVVPLATDVTTQKAAEMLGCSRRRLVKLLK